MPPLRIPSTTTSTTVTSSTTSANLHQIAVTISMYRFFRELPGGGCEGYGRFEGLNANNIAYLTGATDPWGVEGTFATGFTRSETQTSPFYGCDITVTFSTDYPDPRGYYVKVGTQFEAGPFTPTPGPFTEPFGSQHAMARPAERAHASALGRRLFGGID